MVELPRVSGKIRVAFETLAPYDDDDPLHGLFAWIRLVIWTNRDGVQIPHVNVASDLRKLFRANLQTFSDSQTGDSYALYLTDYETPTFETREGNADWEGELTPPRTFLEFLDRDERRQKTREGAGPRSPA